MPLKRRHVKWSAIFPIPGRHGRATLHQEAHYFEVTKTRCQEQGCLLFVAPAVNICTVIDQQLCGVQVSFTGRAMQRSPTIFFACIYVSTAVYQQPCNGNMSK